MVSPRRCQCYQPQDCPRGGGSGGSGSTGALESHHVTTWAPWAAGLCCAGVVSCGVVTMVLFGKFEIESHVMLWLCLLWQGMVTFWACSFSCGMVRYDMVEYGMVWSNMEGYGMVWYNMVEYGMVW